MGLLTFLMRPVVLAVLCLVAGATGGALVNGWRWESKYDQQAAANTAQLKAISDAAAADLQKKLADQQAKQEAVAQQAATVQQQLQAIQDENKTLSAAVASGAQRVRLQAATIATLQRRVSQATGAAGPADDAAVDLTPAAGQTVLDLRAGIESDAVKIKGLQNYILKQCR